MDSRPLFQALAALADDNATFFQQRGGAGGRRLADAFTALRDHAARLEPALRHVARLCHLFDLDEATPGNGYRSLVQTARCCLAHALHKSRCVAAQRRSLFFRAAHNAAELEAYGAALAQLRALLGLAQRLLARNRPGCLFPPEGDGLAQLVLREYSTMHNACFYGRCLGFQFAPSIRPLLQTIAIGLVSYGESYRRNETGLGGAAGSLFTSGKFALDPELRGAEFERVTQNLDVQFWKRFWNLTESELLASVASMAAAQVGVCRALTVPPEPLELPLEADPKVTVTIAPPVAHTGPGPVHMRLLSYQLREGQDSPALTALTRAEGSLGPLRWWRGPPLPPSPALLVHFHGGGFVAQTSRSHEPYLRGWARDLGVPILSVDYALAPEAPFPRALEECFYAYCWALRHCHLLGSTAQRVCLAGDSAGGNLCLAVALRAGAVGVRPPQGLVVAYPVTLVQAAPSPSRLLSLLDPLLPLSVLCACLGAYAGTEEEEEEEKEEEGEGKTAPPPPEPLSPLRLLRDLRQGAAAWLGGLLQGPPPRPEPALTAEGAREEQPPDNPPPEGRDPPEAGEGAQEDPDTFQPLRSRGPPARFLQRPSPLARNPLVSPLLAPDPLLCTLPPLHLVACALDPMLDDSVALARRLRGLGRPVTLRVVPDLPHGFLSLGPLSAETRRATALCTRLIRSVLAPPEPPRRGSLLVGARRDSLAPLDPSRRGSVMLGLRKDSLTPLETTRRGSMMLGSRKDSLTPLETSRRGSVMLGSRRDSLIPSETPRRDSLTPLDSSRRGSVMLGFRRDSLATSETPRRGSMLVGSPKDSLAPQDPPQQGSVMLGSPKDSLAPQDPPQQGSVMLGSPKDSLDPQDPPHQGSMLVGSHEDSPVAPETPRRGSMVSGSHEDTSATHGGGIAATPGTAEARPPIRGLPPASAPPHGALAQPPPMLRDASRGGGGYPTRAGVQRGPTCRTPPQRPCGARGGVLTPTTHHGGGGSPWRVGVPKPQRVPPLASPDFRITQWAGKGKHCLLTRGGGAGGTKQGVTGTPPPTLE